VNALARKAHGMKHRCRFMQLPLNLGMPEAVTLRHQVVSHEKMTVLEAAARYGLAVIGSAALLQARLLDQLPETMRAKFNGLTSDAQRCLQFARSTPGITTALAGMSRITHAEDNLATALVPPLTSEEYQALFT
jgi:predicted aldo/keto reductase-like oxidoreductase